MTAENDPWRAPDHPHDRTPCRQDGPPARFVAWFFARPARTDSLWRIIAWWEARRIAFNLIIGSYGALCLVITLALILSSGRLQPGEDAIEPLGLIAAPVAVNVLYSLGWIVESAARLVGFTIPTWFSPMLLRCGLALGVFLCTVPPAVWVAATVLESLRIPA